MEQSAGKKKTLSRETVILGIVFLAYLVLHAFLAAGHDGWRDEAQAYLIVRDNGPRSLLKTLAVEGHPFFWYLVMWVPVKLGLPFKALSFVSLTVSAVGTGVFLFKAPFRVWQKILMLCSLIFTYSLPVIARDYCLVALLLPLIAAVYPKRYEKPLWYAVLIFLLLQVHVIMAGLSIMLALVSFLEVITDRELRKKLANFLPFCGGAAGVGALIAQLAAGSVLLSLGDEDTTVVSFVLGILSKPLTFLTDMLSGCVDCIRWFTYCENNSVNIALVALMIAVLFFNIALIRYYWREFLIVLGGFGAHVFMHEYLWHYIPQRTICSMFVFLIYVWMILTVKPEIESKVMQTANRIFRVAAPTVLLILCVASYPEMVKEVRTDLTGSYSGGREVAEYIQNELEEDAIVIACTKEMLVTPIVAHFDADERDIFWDPATHGFIRSYVDWEDPHYGVEEGANIGLLYVDIKQYVIRDTPTYLLMSKDYALFDHPELETLECVLCQYDADGCLWDECYALYKLDWRHIYWE